MKTIVQNLFYRRKANIPILYAVAGAFLFVIGLLGFPYGAALLFWPFAIACFSLLLYPTLFAWSIIAVCFLAAAIVYLGFTIIELIREGTNSTIFSDGIIIYILYVAIIIFIALAILISKPSKL